MRSLLFATVLLCSACGDDGDRRAIDAAPPDAPHVEVGCFPVECEEFSDPDPACPMSACPDLAPACEGLYAYCFEGCLLRTDCLPPIDAGPVDAGSDIDASR
jgi:hypothetical protein